MVQEKTYNYIQYPEGDEKISSVVGFIIPINEESRKKILNTGGFYRDLITTLFEDENRKIKRIVILSATLTGMITLTGFFFDDGSKNMKVSWTKEPNIGPFYSKNLKEKGVDFEIVNTLEFLANETDTTKKFFSILEKNFYNPVSVDDTGIEVNGENVEYGKTLIINDVQKIVQKFPQLKDEVLGKLNIDKIELKVNENGPGFMGTIGSGKLINKNGEVITVIYDYYVSYVEEGQTFEDFQNEHIMESLENTAYKINLNITKRPNKKQTIIEDYLKTYDRECQEESEPVSEIIGLNFLLACIEENLVKTV